MFLYLSPVLHPRWCFLFIFKYNMLIRPLSCPWGQLSRTAATTIISPKYHVFSLPPTLVVNISHVEQKLFGQKTIFVISLAVSKKFSEVIKRVYGVFYSLKFYKCSHLLYLYLFDYFAMYEVLVTHCEEWVNLLRGNCLGMSLTHFFQLSITFSFPFSYV